MATALPSGWGQEMVSVIEQTTPSARSKEREHCSIARTPLLRQGGECCFPRTFTTPLSYWYASCERNIEKLEGAVYDRTDG